MIFSPLTIFGAVGDYIVTLYFHSRQYLVRGWLYRDIFSLLTIFSEGVIISWHYIFTPGNIWVGDDDIATYFHSWQYLVREWLYRDMIFSPLTIFGQGVIISWHHIFTPDNISLGGNYIVTSYSHPWQYLVRWVFISWHYIFTPGNIWWGGDYIVTYFHSWQYLVRGWLYRDIFALLTIFGEGVNISWLYIFTPDNIWWWWEGGGGILSWHHIFTPGNIWWGDDYIATLYFHSW